MSLRIVYMGTPDFAVAGLQAIHESEHEIVGVVTVADKPSGRGQKVRMSPVKTYAESQGLKVLQPLKLRDEGFLEELQALQADLFVVVAFRMLPEVVWQMPPLGTINLHGSLLPNYRGAAPIHWAVINGDKETGVSTFFIQKEIDTGAVLLREAIQIGANETTGSLHDRMMKLGAETIVQTLPMIESGEYEAIDQDELIKNEGQSHAPKLFKENTQINWSKTAQEVHNFVRGLNPFPSAWTTDGEKHFKIHLGRPTAAPSINSKQGKLRVQEGSIQIACSDYWFQVDEIQLEGKKRMPSRDLINGLQEDQRRTFEAIAFE